MFKNTAKHGYIILDNTYNSHVNDCVNNYLEKKENDSVLNKIKQEIKFILFNNRKMIVNDID